jgi:phage-related protein
MVTTSGVFILNQGNVFSEPVLKVTLTGDAEIVIGGSYLS